MSAIELQATLAALSMKAAELNTAQGTVQLSALISVLEIARNNAEMTICHSDMVSSSPCAQAFLAVLMQYLGKTARLLDHWRGGNRADREEMKILTAKLTALTELFVPATEVEAEDLCMRAENHISWQRLRQITQLISPDDDVALRQDYETFTGKVALGNAVLTEGSEYHDEYMKRIATGGAAFYYFCCRDSAIQRNRLNHANPDLETAKALWNLVDSRLVSPLYQSMLISIHHNSVIYVPRVAAHVLANISVEDLDAVQHSGKHYIEQLQEEPLYSMVAFTEAMDPDSVRIRVRLLSPYDLPMTYVSQRPYWMCCREVITPGRPIKQLILHFHGGGFIAMSSASHQNYTRRWAVGTNTPVLSVDYRLAPECKYPDALDDCWQAYVWVVRHAKKYLGVTPDKLVLAGDSGGGNLALGVTLRCIQTGEKVPSGLLLSYPCVSMDTQQFSPSLSLCLEDPLVPYSFLKLCSESYTRPGDNPKADPYLSPILIPPSDLSQFPPVRIMVGTLDPLLDHSLKLADKLLDAGVSVKLASFEGMGHGALNLDLAIGVSETRKMVNKGVEFLQELLEV